SASPRSWASQLAWSHRRHEMWLLSFRKLRADHSRTERHSRAAAMRLLSSPPRSITTAAVAAPASGEKDARQPLAPAANSPVMIRNQESSGRGPTGRAVVGLAEASLRNAAARPKVSLMV